jgi:hypothetical protein
MRQISWRRLLSVMSLWILLGLQGCGTPWATVQDGQGRPVMLLGYDPVAYVTRGQPARGDPAFRVDLPQRSYYFANAEHRAMFVADPGRYEPQYGGFCASGAAYAIKLGSDPTSWTVYQGRLFIFGDVLGQTAWQLDPAWNVRNADAQWPAIRDTGWRQASLAAYANKVPHYKTGGQIRAEWQARHPGERYPEYDPGDMWTNLFIKSPGWRAAEGFGQPALGYPP